MMNYADFTEAELAKDEFFQRWVSHPEDERVDMFWKTWLSEHGEKRAEVEAARKILLGIRFAAYGISEEDQSSVWNSIQMRVRGNQRKYDPAVVVKMAVAALLVITVGFFYFLQQTRPYQVHRTTFGQTKTLTLPDGSSVVLNANSKLTINSAWGNDAPREVWLDGEAFFSVIHKVNHQPFEVHTQEVTVEVLGTTFNVYNRTSGTKVILNSGQIRLSLPTQASPEAIMMKPGEMVEYRAEHYEKKAVNPDQYSAWMNNRIILDHTSLADMVHMLEDNYGLEVAVNDKRLLQQTVSGSMPLGDANALIQQLGKAFQLRMTRSGNTVTIEES